MSSPEIFTSSPHSVMHTKINQKRTWTDTTQALQTSFVNLCNNSNIWARVITVFWNCFQVENALKDMQFPNTSIFRPGFLDRGSKKRFVEKMASKWAGYIQLGLLSSALPLNHGEWRKWSPTKEALDCWSNSPCKHCKKCMENSMKNMHSDVRV